MSILGGKVPPGFDCSLISTNSEIVWYSRTFRIKTNLGNWQFSRGSFKRIEGRGQMRIVMSVSNNTAVEPRYNKGPRRWQNSFAITRFRYIIEVLFHMFYGVNKTVRYIENFVKLYRGSLYRGSTVHSSKPDDLQFKGAKEMYGKI